MFAHISLGVTNIERSVDFYDAVMKAIGHDRLFGDIDDEFMAYGRQDCFFIINTPLDARRGDAVANNGAHVCLKAATKSTVDLFYQTALEKGAICDGKPGLRAHYSQDYYAAFVLDPDGHKIEVMTRYDGVTKKEES